MSELAHAPSEPNARVLAWIRRRGVLTVPWSGPEDAAVARPPGIPRLYLVADGASPPPTWGPVEDWVRLPADAIELQARADSILARAAEIGCLLTYVDDDGVLRTGERITILSELQARLVRILLENDGEVVERDDLIRSLWPEGIPDGQRILDSHVSKTRKRLDGIPLRLHTVRGRGFLIERVARLDAVPTTPSALAATGRRLTLTG